MNTQKSTSSRQKRLLARSRQIFFLLIILLIIIWALIPAFRGVTLVMNNSGRSAPHNTPADLPVQEVHFAATDGVHLAGWLVLSSPQAPRIPKIPTPEGPTHTRLCPHALVLGKLLRV